VLEFNRQKSMPRKEDIWLSYILEKQ